MSYVSSCYYGFYRKIGESLQCVDKCEDEEFAGLQTLNGYYQCVTECENKMFDVLIKFYIPFKHCQSEDNC